MLHRLVIVLLLFGSFARGMLNAADSVERAVRFAQVDGIDLCLDLYHPDQAPAVGLIVWVHGGAWRAGSRADVDLARFPAQIHDIKAAIRFLRAHAGKYGFPASRIVIAGSSAGAHLAALTGVTHGHGELEGTLGDHRGTSSEVQAIVDVYGASNLTTILHQSTPHGLNVRQPALDLFLGGQPDAVRKLAVLASPVFHVDAHDPPLLLLHGDQDPQMPINQAHELQGAYEAHGLPVRFVVMHGSAHGGPAFTRESTLQLIDAFLREQLEAAGHPP